MSKALSYLLFACILIGSCAAHSKLWDEIETLEQKVAHTIGNMDAAKMMMEPRNKMNQVLCACENKECQKTPEELSLPIIKSITDKIEKILSKDVFRTIVKRSVVDEEQGQDAKDDVKLMLNIYESIKKMFNLSDKKDVDEFRARLMTIPDNKQMTLKDMIEQIKTAAPKKVEKVEMIKSSMIQIIEKSAVPTKKCEEQTKKIECPTGSKINIVEATVSNKDQTKCSAFSLTTTQAEDVCTEELITTHIVSRNCDGKDSCMLSLENDLSKVCECARNKYLDVQYVCIPEPTMNRVRRQAGGKGKNAGKGGKGKKAGKGGKGKGKGKKSGSGSSGSKPPGGKPSGGKPSGGTTKPQPPQQPYGGQQQQYGQQKPQQYGQQKPQQYGQQKPQYGQQQQSYGADQTNYGTPYNYYKNKPQKVLTIAPRRFLPIPMPMPMPMPIPGPIPAPVAPVAPAAPVAPVSQVQQQPRSATVLTIQPTYQETQSYQSYQQEQPQQQTYGNQRSSY